MSLFLISLDTQKQLHETESSETDYKTTVTLSTGMYKTASKDNF